MTIPEREDNAAWVIPSLEQLLRSGNQRQPPSIHHCASSGLFLHHDEHKSLRHLLATPELAGEPPHHRPPEPAHPAPPSPGRHRPSQALSQGFRPTEAAHRGPLPQVFRVGPGTRLPLRNCGCRQRGVVVSHLPFCRCPVPSAQCPPRPLASPSAWS